MKKSIKKIGFLFKESFSEFIEDNVLKLSAALSYYTIFSIPPLLIIIISLSGLFFGADAVSGKIFGQINGLVGNEVALQIQETIKNVKLSHSNTLITVIGIIALIIGASGVFAEIQDSINYIWGIKAKPKRGLIKFFYNRLMSFSMIVSVSFLFLVSLIINYLMDVLHKRLAMFITLDSFYFFYIINVVIVFVIISLLLIVIFKTLPDGKILMRYCIIGASFTAFLFMLGKFAISYYLQSFRIASTFGTAGSVILILVWVYYSAIILYFGAEFTKVLARNYGHRIVPNAYLTQNR